MAPQIDPMQRCRGETPRRHVALALLAQVRAAPRAETRDLRVSGALSNKEDAVTNVERGLLAPQHVVWRDDADQRRRGRGRR